MKETVNFRVGPLLGENLLEIAQTNISKGNVEYGSTLYEKAFGNGFTKEYMLKVLKNQLIVVTEDDGLSVYLSDNSELLKKNAHNLFDWFHIVHNRLDTIDNIMNSIEENKKRFSRLYCGDIENYSIIEMMKRYFTTEEMKVMSGKSNIAARIIGSFDGKICDTGNSNPMSIWEKLEDTIINYDDNVDNSYAPARWEMILYYTVNHVRLIKNLFKAYKDFETTYFFLVDNDFISHIPFIELTIENVLKTLDSFSNDSKGYYHPLCNTGLFEYKEWLANELYHTRVGNEYFKNKILKKDIMDGYDAGWLSPEGDFYGGMGETSSMIHLNIANEIFKGCSPIANEMERDGIIEYGGSNSPDYWLEKHGWIKIHHNDIYGSFIGEKDPEKRTKDFPYSYCPTDIQIKIICDYIDKFYNGKFYTEASLLGKHSSAEPLTTYKVRQMDEIRLHEIFKY